MLSVSKTHSAKPILQTGANARVITWFIMKARNNATGFLNTKATEKEQKHH